MKKLIPALVLATAVVSLPAFAAKTLKGDHKQDCSHFNIQVSNLTGSTCVLVNAEVKRGNLITPPPGTIMPNDSKLFEMEQTMIGPEIKLSYQCGEENISFTSKQDLCFLEAGNITGSIQAPLPVNINAAYTAIIGSYFWKKPGSMNWRIVKSN